MDRMFLKYKVEPVYMTSAPIPDYSEGRGTAGYGARDMMDLVKFLDSLNF